MKIGIYGGTFNPVHNGHLHLANAVQEALCLDLFLWIPAKLPPHKDAPDLLPGEERLTLLRLATQQMANVEVSSIELESEGKSFTVLTLEKLKKRHPEAEFFLIMGTDMLLTFTQWYRYLDILSMATLVAAARNEGELSSIQEAAKALNNAIVLTVPPFPVSSSEIREKLKQGETVAGLLPESVLQYIEEKQLYQ